MNRPLTPRQREALELLAQGNRQKRAAERLGICTATFKAHLNAAFVKLGAHTDAHAIAIAMRRGLIDPQLN